MSVLESRSPPSEGKVLLTAFALAFVIEILLLTLAGAYEHWLAHPQKKGLDTSQFIETDMVQLPEEAHLEEQKVEKLAPRAEAVLSKVPNQGKQAKPEESKLDEKNQTTGAAPLGPTHGPVAVFSPPPVIPAYLQDQNFKTNVVIDFFVNARGAVTPKLIASSGNDELDAIALSSARKWQFRPAEKDHQPIDAKVRLRIIFEVK